MILKSAEEIKYYPLRYANKHLYYFDGEKIVKDKIEEAYSNIPEIEFSIEEVEVDASYYISLGLPVKKELSKRCSIKGLKTSCFDIEFSDAICFWYDGRIPVNNYEFFFIDYYSQNGNKRINRLLCKMYMAALEEGDTYDIMQKKIPVILERWKNIENKRFEPDTRSIKEKELDRFDTRIERPLFIRYPENDNKDTFDMIKIAVYTCSEWKDKRQYIKHNIKYIYQFVIDKLKNNKSFQNYDVPIGCLAVTSVHETQDYGIMFVLELKKELREYNRRENAETLINSMPNTITLEESKRKRHNEY